MRQDITQEERMLMHILRNKDKKYWYAIDFMPPRLPLEHDLCIGYEASAVMSRLTDKWPMLFNKSKDGRFRIIEFRWDVLQEIKSVVPHNIWELIDFEHRKETNTLWRPA